jgi:hypothetical protein
MPVCRYYAIGQLKVVAGRSVFLLPTLTRIHGWAAGYQCQWHWNSRAVASLAWEPPVAGCTHVGTVFEKLLELVVAANRQELPHCGPRPAHKCRHVEAKAVMQLAFLFYSVMQNEPGQSDLYTSFFPEKAVCVCGVYGCGCALHPVRWS